MPAGTTVALLEGNPAAHAMFTMRLRVPAGSAIAPHWHPREERVTILSGAVDLGFGATASGSVVRYRAGSFYVNPPRVMHYVAFPEATEIQITGLGPWELHETDISVPQGSVASARIMLRDVRPARGTELHESTPIEASVEYEIVGFRPDTFSIAMQFESTSPNVTFGGSVMVAARGDAPPSPPRPTMLTTARGTYIVRQELGTILSNPGLKRPIRCRVSVHEQINATSSRVVGETAWIEYR